MSRVKRLVELIDKSLMVFAKSDVYTGRGTRTGTKGNYEYHYDDDDLKKEKSVSLSFSEAPNLMRLRDYKISQIPKAEKTEKTKGQFDVVNKEGVKLFRGGRDGLVSWLSKDLNKFFEKNSYKKMSRDESIKTIDEKIRYEDLSGWFRNADSNYKKKIVKRFFDDSDIRDASINIMHQQYQDYTGKKIDFTDFLDTPIKVYRGGEKTPTKGASVDDFVGYTFDKRIAESFQEKSSDKKIHSIEIKPRDTYGMLQTTAEWEVLIPSVKLR